MREIKFKGKTLKGNKWVYGYLSVSDMSDNYTITTEERRTFVVVADTIGQYVGMGDINGKDIYENDTIAVSSIKEGWKSLGIVEYNYGTFEFTQIKHIYGMDMKLYHLPLDLLLDDCHCEVVPLFYNNKKEED